jgi:hypothetical protein
MKNLLDFAAYLKKIKMNVGIGSKMWETAEGFYILTAKDENKAQHFTQVYGNLNDPNYTYRLAKKDAENIAAMLKTKLTYSAKKK